MKSRIGMLVLGFGVLALGCGTDDQEDPSEQVESSTGEMGGAEEAGSGAATTETGGSESSGSPTTEGVDPPTEGEITWHRDVRPLVEQHCVSCHTIGEIAPWPLTTFEEAYDLREVIATSVASGSMPPWQASDGCADYKYDRSLTEEEIAVFTGWAAEGGPLGNPDDYASPEMPEQPELSRVDLTIQAPEPYMPVLKPDDYRCFLLDWPEDETKYITGFTVEPDNRSIVHHVISYAISPEAVAEYEGYDAADEGPGYTCFGGPGGDDGANLEGRKWIGAWAPGSVAADFADGTGLKMVPGSKVVLQMHYNSLGSDGVPDQTSVKYKLDDSVEREAFMMPWANPDWLDGGMMIPAGSDDTVHRWELDPTWALPFLTDAIPADSPFLIYNAAHHMHLRGMRGRQVIKRADGSEECLLDIPNYDFNWQGGYSFTEPKMFNPGDTLSLECQWDNADNDKNVNWGEGTGDEMCLGVYFIAAP